jgi:hypothetical protein
MRLHSGSGGSIVDAKSPEFEQSSGKANQRGNGHTGDRETAGADVPFCGKKSRHLSSRIPRFRWSWSACGRGERPPPGLRSWSFVEVSPSLGEGKLERPMSQAPGLKVALKRGALVTAANWPLIAVQFVAENTLKLLLAVPVIGGIFLVVLLLDAEAEELLKGDVRDIVGAVFSAMRASPIALVAFVIAFGLVLLGGSALTFIVKGGTVAVLAQADAAAGPIERPPLRLHALRRAGITNIEPFLDGCRRLWARYVKLGACLLLVYAVTGTAYLGFIVVGYSLAGNSAVVLGWTIAVAAVSSALLVWITLINLVYLLIQMVMAVDDVGVRAGLKGVLRFGRASLREIAGIFGVVLVLVVLATAASILATTGLGMIAFVPLAGFVVFPLTAAGWLIRGLVFQYLALSALGAYLTQYRHYIRGTPLAAVPGKRLA